MERIEFDGTFTRRTSGAADGRCDVVVGGELSELLAVVDGAVARSGPRLGVVLRH